MKLYFPKIIGPVNISSKNAARKHFKNLGINLAIYDSSENSEAAKLLDLVHYSWDIIFCKWVKEVCKNYNLNFEQVYTKHNKIYNRGYRKLRPNVLRPILVPVSGPIGGHCTIEDTKLFDKNYKNKARVIQVLLPNPVQFLLLIQLFLFLIPSQLQYQYQDSYLSFLLLLQVL